MRWPAPAANKLENLRPQRISGCAAGAPGRRPADKVLLENFTDEDNAFYILHVVSEPVPGQLRLHRTIWFSRIDLRLARQMIFDDDGNILTDARYSEWKSYDNVPFPKHIEINRPRDEYGVVIDIVKMDINKGVSEDKFVLDQPPGTALVDLAASRRRPGRAGRRIEAVINKLVLENLKHRPMRSLLSILLIGVPVTLILTLVGLSRGHAGGLASTRPAGVGADIIVRGSTSGSIVSFSGTSIPEALVAKLEQQPHVQMAMGVIVHPFEWSSTSWGSTWTSSIA